MPANFDLIPSGAALDASTVNIPLQQLDNAIAKKNLSSSTNPTVNDDTLDGYGVGSIWVNQLLGRVFFAVDVSSGAAVWMEVTSRFNNLTALTNPAVTDDEDDGYGVGSLWINNSTQRTFIAIDVSSGAAVWQGISYPASTLVVDASGRLLLGRSSAVAAKANVTAGIQSLATDNRAGGLAGRFSADALPAQYTFAKSRHATVGSHTVVQNSDSLGILSFQGSDGTDFEVGANIEAIIDGTPANNVMPTSLVFRTTPAASATPVIRLYINAAGRIGIGQSPDAAKIFAVTGDGIITGDFRVTGEFVASDVTSSDIDNASTITTNSLEALAGIGIGPAPGSLFATNAVIVDQGINDDAIFVGQSSDIAHGMTTVADNHTFTTLKKASGNQGGVELAGISENVIGIMLEAYATNEENFLTTAANGYIVLRGQKISGTGKVAPSANQNLAVFHSGNANAKFIFTTDGNSYEDGTGWTPYDDWDDAALLDLVNAALVKSQDPVQHGFWEWAGENAMILQRLSLVKFNEDGHHFINRSKMQELLVGWARQATKELRGAREEIKQLIGRVEALEVRKNDHTAIH